MSDAPSARLFVAVDPPAQVCERAGRLGEKRAAGSGHVGGKTSSVRVLDAGDCCT